MYLSFTFSLVGFLFLVSLVLFAMAIKARAKGKIKNSNFLVRLMDNLVCWIYGVGNEVVDSTRDSVRSAEYDIANAKKELENFEDKIVELRQQVIREEKRLTGLQKEVEKWENIYKAAHAAGDEEGKAEAARRLKTSDGRLTSVKKLVSDNRNVIEELESQRSKIREGIDNAEVMKDRLAAQKLSAELRAKAMSSGVNASNTLNILSELENDVVEAESRLEALEETENADNSLETKYAVEDSDDEFNDRLNKLVN